MAITIQPMEARGGPLATFGALARIVANPTHATLDRADSAQGVASPGLQAVLREAAWSVDPGVVTGALAQPAVVQGAPAAELILAQDAGMLGGDAARSSSSTTAAAGRVLTLLGLAEAGWRVGDALGQDYVGPEGVMGRRIGEVMGTEQVPPFSPEGLAVGEAVGTPSLWSMLRGTAQIDYSNDLLSLKGGESVDSRTMPPADLAYLIEAPWPDAQGIRRNAAALGASAFAGPETQAEGTAGTAEKGNAAPGKPDNGPGGDPLVPVALAALAAHSAADPDAPASSGRERDDSCAPEGTEGHWVAFRRGGGEASIGPAMDYQRQINRTPEMPGNLVMEYEVSIPGTDIAVNFDGCAFWDPRHQLLEAKHGYRDIIDAESGWAASARQALVEEATRQSNMAGTSHPVEWHVSEAATERWFEGVVAQGAPGSKFSVVHTSAR